ncbi:NADH dehydrogenase subunit 6 (mitochondrion) [Aethina tumida]|uniref:NADH-ubiquinone oxidoreductase chain 6 n=1 Tax=Aethina tumida TaxID=116153 RepID=A0A343KHV4_AETTU|nr:NADH dehydrogenase subunit 6 [Aethina tumida]ATG28324.1 NADH dehydrogenase subunit 6 [Aethina tumida]
MNFLMILSLSLSLSFLFMKHPLSLGFILLLQTATIALITGLLNYNFWFSYILFLVMIGGMLILFIYMTSITSNKKFKFSNSLMFMIFFLMLLFILSFIADQYFFNFNNLNMNMLNYEINLNNFSLNKFLNYPNYIVLFMLYIYLFITLIAVTKISNLKSGPLRQKF